MKPLAIFRFFPSEGPGYFATFLERLGLPWLLVPIDEGAAVPGEARAYSGLVLMGGPMSANDDLPWIPPLLDLLRGAVRSEVPLLGHCLGGQLMARALGGAVGANPVREIGWGEVEVAEGPLAREWFGGLGRFPAFHWHGETFSIPAGATRLLASRHCANQAFALGPHLALQCHVEMTAAMLRDWCRGGAAEIAAHPGPAVQSAAAMQEALDERVAALNWVADLIYSRWVEGLRREA